MAYDEELAERVREFVFSCGDLAEKKMFGGLAFLIGGNMAVAASRKGGLLVRVDPADSAALIDGEAVVPMVMGGREMHGWLYVAPELVEDVTALQEWVARGVDFAAALPRKR
ncbi:TfoX/Sxy family protein [Nocardia sp. NPDC058640]|uniref:TfoX/Sxy family protein n=1 Tax=Nocardia sp. NPDC058640 TaxID=3346571 RepID=UPI00366A146D